VNPVVPAEKVVTPVVFVSNVELDGMVVLFTLVTLGSEVTVEGSAVPPICARSVVRTLYQRLGGVP
jgi:hypothetical protein